MGCVASLVALGGIFPVERFGISSFIFFPLRFLAN